MSNLRIFFLWQTPSNNEIGRYGVKVTAGSDGPEKHQSFFPNFVKPSFILPMTIIVIITFWASEVKC